MIPVRIVATTFNSHIFPLPFIIYRVSMGRNHSWDDRQQEITTAIEKEDIYYHWVYTFGNSSKAKDSGIVLTYHSRCTVFGS